MGRALSGVGLGVLIGPVIGGTLYSAGGKYHSFLLINHLF